MMALVRCGVFGAVVAVGVVLMVAPLLLAEVLLLVVPTVLLDVFPVVVCAWS